MKNNDLIFCMTEFDGGVPERVQHFLKVYAFSHLLGTEEHLTEHQLRILDAAAILHDIGIKPSLEKYGNSAGPNQEKEGPPIAREMLTKQGEFTEEEINRICFLIGHHHTYSEVDGMDYQILLEADFLVNAYEGNLPKENIVKARDRFFKTTSGKRMLNTMFAL